MRKSGMKVVMLLLSWSVLFASFAPQAKAQNEGEATTPIAIVPIKNVRAEVMAWWVTPRKDAKPVPKTFDKNDRTPYTGAFDLIDFPGIESITANAAKNELWVQGTPEAVQKLRDIVGFLDRPVRSVEIKAWFVAVDVAEVAGLGIESKPDGAIGTIVFNNEIRNKLKILIGTNRAEVIQTAQITTLNNSTSSASWNSYAMLPPTDLHITPTIQNDDTVTMFLSPRINAPSPFPDKRPGVFISTVANVKQGDVILVQMKPTDDGKRAILLLVSAEIIKDQAALLD